MNLKRKTAIFVSVLFTLIYALSATVIFIMFSNFRKAEFENRLKINAVSAIKLFVDNEDVDKKLLKTLHENGFNKLYNGEILIFDKNYNKIYGSLDNTKIKWSRADLEELEKINSFYRKDNDVGIFGLQYRADDKNYYSIISAYDNYGNRISGYLIYILISTYLVLTSVTWLLSNKIVKKMLMPIDVFHNRIKNISDFNLDVRLEVKDNKDEIDLLAVEFNQMLERINESYKKQQEFTANASHELRTPLARLLVQLENRINEEKKIGSDYSFNANLLNDVNMLSELTNSLLLLSKLEKDNSASNEIYRLDEVIFIAFETVNKIFPDFKMDFEADEMENFEINCNKSLITIALSNLFKNAYLYADKKFVSVKIMPDKSKTIVKILNDGSTLSDVEVKSLFEPFYRGKNSLHISGQGIGLPIVKRILSQQKATIAYAVTSDKRNEFTLTFSL